MTALEVVYGAADAVGMGLLVGLLLFVVAGWAKH